MKSKWIDLIMFLLAASAITHFTFIFQETENLWTGFFLIVIFVYWLYADKQIRNHSNCAKKNKTQRGKNDN